MFHFTGYRDYLRRAAVTLGLDAPVIPGMALAGGLVPLTRLASLIGQASEAPAAARAAIHEAARTSEDALALAALAAQVMLAESAEAFGLPIPPVRLIPASDVESLMRPLHDALNAALAESDARRVRVAELESQLAALAPGAKRPKGS